MAASGILELTANLAGEKEKRDPRFCNMSQCMCRYPLCDCADGGASGRNATALLLIELLYMRAPQTLVEIYPTPVSTHPLSG